MARLLAYLLPAVCCLTLYWPGLFVWFSGDDFAWLGLRLMVHSPGDLLHVLFEPRAQGTIRPLSERLFFLGGEYLFGLDALPFRIVVFATQLLNLVLLARLVERLTGSTWAGMWTALFWMANASLAQAMSWTSAYNQVLWPCFVLCALHQRVTGIRTGSRRAFALEWLFFILGFGALELNVVYPGLALLVTLVSDRTKWRQIVPQFGIAVAYTALHRWVAVPEGGPVYSQHFDFGVAKTLLTYLRMSLGLWRPVRVPTVIPWWAAPLAVAGMAAAIAVLAWRKDKWLLFGLSWFLFVLAPVLPLRDHVTDYYLTVPMIGLAWLAGVATARYPLVAILPACAYLAASGALARKVVMFNYDRSLSARNLVLGVEEVTRLHPGKMILLSGVSSGRFWTAVSHNPFRLLPGARVYLAPGTTGNIEKRPELGDPSMFVLPLPAANRAVRDGDALVYAAGGDPLTNITPIWRQLAERQPDQELATVVDVGQPLLAEQLLTGWHENESGFRWMSGRGVLRLGAPREFTRVFVKAYRPPGETTRKEITLRLLVNGRLASVWTEGERVTSIEQEADLPPGIDRSKPIQVELQVTPVRNEGRELGVALGTIGLR